MKYLVMMIWDQEGLPMSFSKEMTLAGAPADCGEDILEDLDEDVGCAREDITDLFVLESSDKGQAPKIAAHWTQDDALLLGEDADDDDDGIDESASDDDGEGGD